MQLVQPCAEWAPCFLEDETPSLLTRVKIVPLILAASGIPVAFRVPDLIAYVHAVIASVEPYEDEAPVRMIIQSTINPYSFILIKCLDEIQKVLFILNGTLRIWHGHM